MDIIRVKAFPDSKKAHIEEVDNRVLRVFVREAPKDNRANRAIIKAVAAYYEIDENKLRIISGHHGLNKMIEIHK
jgi:uncharacterized protein YggU (UPF0235/DUF167 family)